MKIYEIYDEENKLSIGTLLYYKKSKTFLIELCDYLDEWTAPLLFTKYVKNGIFSIPRRSSFTWVTERIIPSGRQNIGSILNTHKLKSYDEMTFLEISQGRCSQDSLCIRKIDSIPDYVIARKQQNLVDCVQLDDNSILCFFQNDVVKKIDLNSIDYLPGIDKVIRNSMLFDSCTLGVDGYYISFDNSIDIPSWELYKNGKEIPISYRDFISFSQKNIFDTSKSCDVLECSRQNLAYMVKQDQLQPIKENVKGNLFLKKDVLRNLW